MARKLSTGISSLIIAATIASVGAAIAATAVATGPAPVVAFHAVGDGADNTPWG